MSVSERRSVQLRAVDPRGDQQQVPRAIVAKFQNDPALDALRAVLERFRQTRADAAVLLQNGGRR
jgi:hypothetical protein